jgi:hypothetical protein
MFASCRPAAAACLPSHTQTIKKCIANRLTIVSILSFTNGWHRYIAYRHKTGERKREEATDRCWSISKSPWKGFDQNKQQVSLIYTRVVVFLYYYYSPAFVIRLENAAFAFALPFNLAPTLISDHSVCVGMQCSYPYRHFTIAVFFLALFGSSPMDNRCYSFLFFFGYRQPCIQLEDFEKKC